MELEIQNLYQNMMVHHLDREEIVYELTIRAVEVADRDSKAALMRRLKDRLKTEKNEPNPDIDFSRCQASIDQEIRLIDREVKYFVDVLENRIPFDGIRDTLRTRLTHFYVRCTRVLEVAEADADLKDLDKLQAAIRGHLHTFFSPLASLHKAQSTLMANIVSSLAELNLAQKKKSKPKKKQSYKKKTNNFEIEPENIEKESCNESESENDSTEEEGAIGFSLGGRKSSTQPRILKSISDQPRMLKTYSNSARNRVSDSEENERFINRVSLRTKTKYLPSLLDSSDFRGSNSDSDTDDRRVQPRRREERSPQQPYRSRRGRPVSDWNLWYDGKDNGQGLMGFLREVEFTADSENVSRQELFRSAINLFRGPAKTWFMSGVENEEFSSWKQLVREIKNEFLSPDHDHASEMRAIARKQGPKEKFQNYLTEMQKIFNGFTKRLTEKRKFQIIFRNMRADYRGFAIASQIDNLVDLKSFGRKLDATFWYKFQSVDDNPQRMRNQVNEVYTGTKPKTRNDSEKYHQKPRYFYGNSKYESGNDDKHYKKGFRDSNKSIQELPSKKVAPTDGLELLLAQYSPLPEGICYNCRLRGHHHKECNRPAHVFCHRCGFMNFETNNCPFCSKNFQKTA
ncbi:uncharacterized protein LOC129757606 [Uranotaenia lowii]|uniref:uncharacterized protein LOC129757606 n=1 Tax=Uranotaenia lowii TaxID=190385 RepID=UPI0024796445|nr:uncharacterized protein LOC129757606 [Uranotaenia lowii]XP_055610865.1 uncharacterized protein LOC129757606 [Uranotaenia lowii]XP_055610870.1 uncharacterized protein LOC129757606 [Uranotaenia lowii]